MDEFNDNINDDFDDFEESNSFSTQSLDSNTFTKRNDPQELLFRYKLQLMNAYRVEVTVLDTNNHNVPKKVFKIKRKKGTNPKANSQGIEDIISYVEKLVNNHTVQGNITDMREFNNMMLYISQDITKHFMENRVTWAISISDVDVMIAGAINLITIFLTRLLYNEERKGYGESYKETTSRKIEDNEKPNMFQRMGTMFGRR